MKKLSHIFSPFISNKLFEKNGESQQRAISHFLQVLGPKEGTVSAERGMDFYFQAQRKVNAESLHNELILKGYLMNEIKQSGEDRFYITGNTPPISFSEGEFRAWVAGMNELGFIHDCFFDGWGYLRII